MKYKWLNFVLLICLNKGHINFDLHKSSYDSFWPKCYEKHYAAFWGRRQWFIWYDYVMITGIIQPLYNQILKSSSSVGKAIGSNDKDIAEEKIIFLRWNENWIM